MNENREINIDEDQDIIEEKKQEFKCRIFKCLINQSCLNCIKCNERYCIKCHQKENIKLNKCMSCKKKLAYMIGENLTTNCDQILLKCHNFYLGCKVSLPRKKIIPHHKICEFRIYNCEECNEEVLLKDKSLHHQKCIYAEITCPHCYDHLLRNNLERHLHNECNINLNSCIYCFRIFFSVISIQEHFKFCHNHKSLCKICKFACNENHNCMSSILEGLQDSLLFYSDNGLSIKKSNLYLTANDNNYFSVLCGDYNRNFLLMKNISKILEKFISFSFIDNLINRATDFVSKQNEKYIEPSRKLVNYFRYKLPNIQTHFNNLQNEIKFSFQDFKSNLENFKETIHKSIDELCKTFYKNTDQNCCCDDPQKISEHLIKINNENYMFCRGLYKTRIQQIFDKIINLLPLCSQFKSNSLDIFKLFSILGTNTKLKNSREELFLDAYEVIIIFSTIQVIEDLIIKRKNKVVSIDLLSSFLDPFFESIKKSEFREQMENIFKMYIRKPSELLSLLTNGAHNDDRVANNINKAKILSQNLLFTLFLDPIITISNFGSILYIILQVLNELISTFNNEVRTFIYLMKAQRNNWNSIINKYQKEESQNNYYLAYRTVSNYNYYFCAYNIRSRVFFRKEIYNSHCGYYNIVFHRGSFYDFAKNLHGTYIDKCLRIELKENDLQITSIACLNRKKSNITLVSSKNYLYSISGFYDGNYLTSCEIYDSLKDRWSIIFPLNRIQKNSSALFLQPNWIYCIGESNFQPNSIFIERIECSLMKSYWESCNIITGFSENSEKILIHCNSKQILILLVKQGYQNNALYDVETFTLKTLGTQSIQNDLKDFSYYAYFNKAAWIIYNYHEYNSQEIARIDLTKLKIETSKLKLKQIFI